MVCYDDALEIRAGERDHELDLGSVEWPHNIVPPPHWAAAGGCLQRIVTNEPSKPTSDRPTPTPADELPACSLKESILQFPSAPIYGVQRLHEYHVNLPDSQSLHTYRVLTAACPGGRIKRILLFHNGLNELDRMGLYYQLASHLIAQEPETACILRPFPGHLTRAPFAEFAETPLHRYLWDGSHLFRQFLRYMTETRWFLSALVKRSRYRCPGGAGLLAENDDPAASRLDLDILTAETAQAWERLHTASYAAFKLARARKENQSDAPKMPGRPPRKVVFREAAVALQEALKLDEYNKLDSDLKCGDEEPSLHVIGYSLGGFTAQSVFMSWPFLVGSCSTLLSGGPLRELAPTAFADPEEWQTVLHSLRYELDEGMLNDRYGREKQQLAGLPTDLFLYFQRTFYEVFQQEYRGSYQSRLAAFRQRMFFIVGGDDPIVRPRSVLDSGPPGGINLLAIGGLGHFLGSTPKDHEERKQRRFWLPEIGELIGRFSNEAAKRHDVERRKSWLEPDFAIPDPQLPGEQDAGRAVADEDGKLHQVQRLSERDLVNIPHDGALPSKPFELCLDDLLARQDEPDRNLLLILRNEIPTLLLSARAVQRRARALHHDELGIVEFCQGVRMRWEKLQGNLPRTRIVLPWNVRHIFLNMDPEHRFPSQSETAVGQMPDEITWPKTWRYCSRTLEGLANSVPGSVLIYDGRDKPLTPRLGASADDLVRDWEKAARGPVLVPSLPDCWISMSPKFLGLENDFTADDAFGEFLAKAWVHQKSGLGEKLHNDDLRIIAVSRARYNPRFRGRLVVNTGAARKILLHAALCLAASYKYDEYDLDKGKPSTSGGRPPARS
ncbi:MAG: hypothetical protein ACRDLF_08605 [Solirubrobacteraceae bacterium]